MSLAVAGLLRLGLAVEQHGAVAVDEDDAEGELVEFELAEPLDVRGKIRRAEVDRCWRTLR